MSYAYARGRGEVSGRKVFEDVCNRSDCDVMLDCGAHTVYNSGGTLTLDEYCEFLDEYSDRLYSYVALDVIGNPEKTADNLSRMIEAGYKPLPIHVLGDEQKRMDELFELSDYVALGGMIRQRDLKLKRAFVYSYIKQKMQWAKGRKVHWFGFTRKDLLPTMRPFSSDSCTWANGQLYGQCCVYLGNGRWLNAYSFKDRAKVMRNPQAMRICEQVVPGFRKRVDTPAAWKHSKKDAGCIHLITTDSWVRWCVDVSRMFGTRVFLATNPNYDLVNPLIEAVERNAWRFGT